MCLGSLYGQGPAGLRIQFCFLHVIPAHQKIRNVQNFLFKKNFYIERISLVQTIKRPYFYTPFSEN